MTEPRIWTLGFNGSEKITSGPPLKHEVGPEVRVVEAAPVVDLLERLSKFLADRCNEGDEQMTLYVDTESLLSLIAALRPT